jgi:hypothetical protein
VGRYGGLLLRLGCGWSCGWAVSWVVADLLLGCAGLCWAVAGLLGCCWLLRHEACCCWLAGKPAHAICARALHIHGVDVSLLKRWRWAGDRCRRTGCDRRRASGRKRNGGRMAIC